jgi:hypothetical protein
VLFRKAGARTAFLRPRRPGSTISSRSCHFQMDDVTNGWVQFMKGSECRTTGLSQSGSQGLWYSLGLAAFAGAIAGGLLGLSWAAVVHIMRGLALDGDPPPPLNFAQALLLYLILVGLGAGLGAIVFMAVAGFVLATWKALKADPNHRSRGSRLAKIAVAFVLLAVFVCSVLIIMRRSFR